MRRRAIRRNAVPLAALVLSLACGSSESGAPPPDAASRRARDSAIAESGLPGAAGVRKALDAADSAAARRALLDSIAQTE